MKKLLFIAAALPVLLAGCDEKPKYCSAYFITDYNDRFRYQSGELYTDDMTRLHFCDFLTVKDALICPKPNCTHSGESCPAFGMSVHPTAVDGSIYFFEDSSHYEDGRAVSSTDIYKAAIDGTGRTKIDTLDGLTVFESTSTAFGNGVLYFAGSDMFPENAPDGFTKTYLCGYDFINRKLILNEPVCEGYGGNITFCGELGGEIYLVITYRDGRADIQRGDSEEIKRHNAEEMKRVSKCEHKKLNVKTLEITDWEIPEKIAEANAKRAEDPNLAVPPVFAQAKGGALVYSDGTDTLIVNQSGREIFLKGYDSSDCAIENGYIFGPISDGECKARRISDGKEVRFNIETENISCDGYVAGYADGRYIIRYYNAKTQTTEYFPIADGILK